MSDQPTPPVARSQLWQQLNESADAGLFKLQVCSSCSKVQYPPQEFCSHCLADKLSWEQVSPVGKVLSWTITHASTNRFFKGILPVHVGMVKLDCGPVMIAYLAASCLQTGSRVQVTGRPDKSGQCVFFAVPQDTDPKVEFNDIMMQEAKHDEK